MGNLKAKIEKALYLFSIVKIRQCTLRDVIQILKKAESRGYRLLNRTHMGELYNDILIFEVVDIILSGTPLSIALLYLMKGAKGCGVLKFLTL